MPLDANDPNVQDAVFGRQVAHFLQTDIGRYLTQRAQEDIESAVEELKTVDPHNPVKVTQAQNRVAVAETVMGWLGDAIIKGQAAQDIIEGD